MRIFNLIIAIAIALLLAGCRHAPAAQFTQTVIWKQADGRADNAENPPLPPHRDYSGDGSRADDGQTFSGSHVIKWNKLGGYVHAIPGDAPNEQEDAATATSNNKARTEFVVNRAGNFTFDAKLELDGIEIIRDARVSANMTVIVQDARGRPITDAAGNPVPNRGFAGTYSFSNDSSGNLQVTPSGGNLSGDEFDDTKSTGGNGVALGPGTYWIQMEMNASALANTSFPDPAQKPEGHIDTAKLTLSLR